MQYDINPIFLSSMATIQYMSFPLLSLGSSTARLNPKLSTSPIARKIKLVGQTKLIIRRDLQRYQIMHIRIQRNQILFIDNLDHKPTIHRISTNTPQKEELHQIDLQENRGELCIEIQRERRSHLANNYGPEGLW